MAARVDDAGDLVVMDEQDSSKWDQQLISLGFHHFNLSIGGTDVSRYHVEAAIAATHARGNVDWRIILKLYDELLMLDGGSPVVRLNRAVAVSRLEGPEAGLKETGALIHDAKLRDYHLLLATRAHFLQQLGRISEAAEAYRGALACRCSKPERRFLLRKLTTLSECCEPR
jgi:RNA polymerase sigma-70 factor (ECF subfamily)